MWEVRAQQAWLQAAHGQRSKRQGNLTGDTLSGQGGFTCMPGPCPLLILSCQSSGQRRAPAHVQRTNDPKEPPRGLEEGEQAGKGKTSCAAGSAEDSSPLLPQCHEGCLEESAERAAAAVPFLHPPGKSLCGKQCWEEKRQQSGRGPRGALPASRWGPGEAAAAAAPPPPCFPGDLPSPTGGGTGWRGGGFPLKLKCLLESRPRRSRRLLPRRIAWSAPGQLPRRRLRMSSGGGGGEAGGGAASPPVPSPPPPPDLPSAVGPQTKSAAAAAAGREKIGHLGGGSGEGDEREGRAAGGRAGGRGRPAGGASYRVRSWGRQGWRAGGRGAGRAGVFLPPPPAAAGRAPTPRGARGRGVLSGPPTDRATSPAQPPLRLPACAARSGRRALREGGGRRGPALGEGRHAT